MRPLLPLLSLLLLACAGPEKQGPAPSPDPRDSASPADTGPAPGPEALAELLGLGLLDVIVIHADTLRADRMGLYGHTRDTTPGALARPHLIVHGYHAAASWTLPSTASALLSVTPEVHGRVAIGLPSDARGLATLGLRLGEAGYTTGMFSGNSMLPVDALLSTGFDMRLGVDDIADVESQTLGALSAQALEWMETQDDETPLFIWIQSMDTHVPWRPQEPFRGAWADYAALPFDPAAGWEEQSAGFVSAWESAGDEAEREALVENVRAVYDELVLQEHSAVEDLLDALAASGRADRTLVVLSSDHGETIGDDLRPSISHGGTLRPELVQIPLVFFHPSLSGAEATCLSSNVDLGPTLMRALGLEAGAALDGQPLQDACREVVVSSAYSGDATSAALSVLSAADASYKLDWNCLEGVTALYDRALDPAALDPLDPAEHPQAAAPLEAALRETLARAQAADPTRSCAPSAL